MIETLTRRIMERCAKLLGSCLPSQRDTLVEILEAARVIRDEETLDSVRTCLITEESGSEHRVPVVGRRSFSGEPRDPHCLYYLLAPSTLMIVDVFVHLRPEDALLHHDAKVDIVVDSVVKKTLQLRDVLTIDPVERRSRLINNLIVVTRGQRVVIVSSEKMDLSKPVVAGFFALLLEDVPNSAPVSPTLVE